jgi:chitinase
MHRLLLAPAFLALTLACSAACAQDSQPTPNDAPKESATSAAQARPNHLVLGYLPYWRDNIAPPQDLDLNVFTHLARAFLRPERDGSLHPSPTYFNLAFEDSARAHDVKLLMSIGGESATPDIWLAMAREPQHVAHFLDTLAALFAAHHYDGVDIDWEPPPQNAVDGQTYLSFLQAIRHRFPGRLLTIAVEASNYGVGHLPMADVVANVDFINAMTYDFSGPWTGIASFATNLHSDSEGLAHTRVSVDDELKNLIQTHRVPAAKVLVGLQFWANRFRVDQLGDHFPLHTNGYADNIEYARVMDLLGTGRYTAMRDEIADEPYLVRNDGGCVVTYDDPKSIRDKCETAIELHCAGVMIWHAGSDLGGGQMPLLNAVAESVGLSPLPSSRTELEGEIARIGNHPVPTSVTLEALEQDDARLRNLRGQEDDDHWIAAAPAATQPTKAK